MKKIDRYETISKAITSQIKKGVKTNNFLSENDLKMEIQNGTLYYCEYNGGLLILRDRGTHYILNYYINDITKKIEEQFEKDIVTEIVTRPNDDNGEIVKYFENTGMQIKLKRVRLVHKECENVSCESIECIRMCTMQDMVCVDKILKENFDTYTGCIPTKNMLLDDIEKENIYVYDYDGIKGILQINKNNASSEIKHLVVVPEERKKGIAKKLVDKYFQEIQTKKKTVWTGKENVSAINLYKKMGYEFDGYKSTVLIKRKEK